MRISFSVHQIAHAVWNLIAEASRIVRLSPGTGTGQISLSSGAVTVGTNNDKTGYTASTVSDKAGYSLTAGSYSVRASSMQRGTVSLTTETSGSVTISSVTTTRATQTGNFNSDAASDGAQDAAHMYSQLSAATTVTFTRRTGDANNTAATEVMELF